MTPPVQIGDAVLYQGRAEDVLPGLPPARLVVTDPPYRLTSGGKKSGHLKGKFGGGYVNNGRMVPCDITWPEIMALVAAALDPAGGDAYVMSDDKNLAAAEMAARTAGLKHHRHMVWAKGQGTPNRWYMKSAEFALYLYLGRARTVNDCGAGQVFEFRPGTDTAHPTQKPVALMQAWIEQSSDPGDLVIDPFMGSGTTGLAALITGRRFIGIELVPEYFEISRRRLAALTTGASLTETPDLFSERKTHV